LPTSPLLIDPFGDPDLKQKIDKMKPTPGYCIFIDIVGSTAMKQESMYTWIAKIYNTFQDTDSFFRKYQPLKSIGDELMYFIEEDDLINDRESVFLLYDRLFGIAANYKPDYPETKICAAYCENVLPLTFLKDTKDYYGIDIDRAARLKGVDPPLKPREILIDHGMFSRINRLKSSSGPSLNALDNNRSEGFFSAKGIQGDIKYYRINAEQTIENDFYKH